MGYGRTRICNDDAGGHIAGEDIGPAQRMPTKRVAFAPGPASAGAPGAPGHGVPPPPPPPAAAGPSRTSPRTGNGPTPGATPRPFPGPRPGNEGLRPPAPQRGNYPMPIGGAMRPPTDPARRTDPIPNLSAEELADSKGKEMAMKACRSLTVDAVKEDNLVVSAAKICAAGHILGLPRIVDMGKDAAKWIRPPPSPDSIIIINRGRSSSPGEPLHLGQPSRAGPTAGHWYPIQVGTVHRLPYDDRGCHAR